MAVHASSRMNTKSKNRSECGLVHTHRIPNKLIEFNALYALRPIECEQFHGENLHLELFASICALVGGCCCCFCICCTQHYSIEYEYQISSRHLKLCIAFEICVLLRLHSPYIIILPSVIVVCMWRAYSYEIACIPFSHTPSKLNICMYCKSLPH